MAYTSNKVLRMSYKNKMEIASNHLVRFCHTNSKKSHSGKTVKIFRRCCRDPQGVVVALNPVSQSSLYTNTYFQGIFTPYRG